MIDLWFAAQLAELSAVLDIGDNVVTAIAIIAGVFTGAWQATRSRQASQEARDQTAIPAELPADKAPESMTLGETVRMIADSQRAGAERAAEAERKMMQRMDRHRADLMTLRSQQDTLSADFAKMAERLDAVEASCATLTEKYGRDHPDDDEAHT